MADLKKTAENLKARGFGVQLFQTKEEAADYLNKAIDGKTVGFGGSVTLRLLALAGYSHFHRRGGEGSGIPVLRQRSF
jgi:L-lactate utilization protein LutB